MHAKFTLKYSYVGSEDYSPMDITFEIPGDANVDQMLFNFECFLKACGFVFDGKFIQSQEDGYDLRDEEPEGGCMADWDDQDTPSFHDTLSTSICEEVKKKKFSCGLEETSSSLEEKREKFLKEWNEGIAKLDNEQKQKCREEALKMSGLHDEATKEVVKNNWVHGMCNPPSPDWKK
jgi:hypothetical protein